MAITLEKGQKIDLTKTNPGLKKLHVGLGWDTNKYDGGADFDLDAAAFCWYNWPNVEPTTSPRDSKFQNPLRPAWDLEESYFLNQFSNCVAFLDNAESLSPVNKLSTLL